MSEHGNQHTVPWHTGVIAARAGAARRPGYTACEADLEAYRRDGVVLLRGAFGEWVERLRAGLERNLRDPAAFAFPCESVPHGEPGRFFDSYCNAELIPEYTDFVLHSCAAAMAASFMGATCARFFHDHAFCKEPGTARPTPWHQDMPYYCVDGTQTVSVYVSLDEVPEEVAVRFVAGSHRSGSLHYPRHFLDGANYAQDDPALTSAPDVDARQRDFDVRGWTLAPGDAVLFDFRTLHGTGGTAVRARRRAFSTRWLGDDVCYCERPGETSPPYGDIGLRHGDPLREDLFPVLWPCAAPGHP